MGKTYSIEKTGPKEVTLGALLKAIHLLWGSFRGGRVILSHTHARCTVCFLLKICKNMQLRKNQVDASFNRQDEFEAVIEQILHKEVACGLFSLCFCLACDLWW